eukprot:1504617-Rhodomonas_salina.1
MTILIFNACVGVWQEKRAESAIEALQSYNPEKAKVLRNGKIQIVMASEVVPSDIVEVNVGDKVRARRRRGARWGRRGRGLSERVWGVGAGAGGHAD